MPLASARPPTGTPPAHDGTSAARLVCRGSSRAGRRTQTTETRAVPQPVQAFGGPLPEGYDMRTSEVLNRAADLIEERGWTQGVGGFYGESGLCILGSLGAALDISMDGGTRHLVYSDPAAAALFAHLGAMCHDVWESAGAVWRWHDNHERTAAEVIETLRAAALIEQAREDQALAADFIALAASPA